MTKLVPFLAVIAALAALTANAAVYIEYQLYSTSTCTEASLTQRGIYSAENECVPNGISGSRVFSCSAGLTIYPASSVCRELDLPEIPDNLKSTNERLDLCRPARSGSTTEFIKYACRSGGWARVISSTGSNCTQLEAGASGGNDDFYLANSCNAGFSDATNTASQSSTYMVQTNSTAFALLQWENTIGCSGTPNTITNFTVGCTVKVDPFTSATEYFFVKLQGAASAVQLSLAAVSVLVAAFAVVSL